jgi:hypothetical protein
MVYIYIFLNVGIPFFLSMKLDLNPKPCSLVENCKTHYSTIIIYVT